MVVVVVVVVVVDEGGPARVAEGGGSERRRPGPPGAVAAAERSQADSGMRRWWRATVPRTHVDGRGVDLARVLDHRQAHGDRGERVHCPLDGHGLRREPDWCDATLVGDRRCGGAVRFCAFLLQPVRVSRSCRCLRWVGDGECDSAWRLPRLHGEVEVCRIGGVPCVGGVGGPPLRPGGGGAAPTGREASREPPATRLRRRTHLWTAEGGEENSPESEGSAYTACEAGAGQLGYRSERSQRAKHCNVHERSVTLPKGR